MSWYNEPRRHALSAKGVKTAVDEKPFHKRVKRWELLPSKMFENKEEAEVAASELRKFNHKVDVRPIKIKGFENFTHGVYIKKDD